MRTLITVLLVSFITSLATAEMPTVMGMDQDGAYFAENAVIIAFNPENTPLSLSTQSGTFITGMTQVDELNLQFNVTYMWPLFPKAEKYGEYAMAGYYSITFDESFGLETVLDAYNNLDVVNFAINTFI